MTKFKITDVFSLPIFSLVQQAKKSFGKSKLRLEKFAQNI